MAFDGIPRPSQLYGYNDPLGAYIGANQAAEEARRKPTIEKKRETQADEGIHKHLVQYDFSDDDDGEGLTPEEYEQVMIFAKLRGIMNLVFEEGVTYRFDYNTETGLVDLTDDRDHQVILSLTVDELIQVSSRMHRYAGMMANRRA